MKLRRIAEVLGSDIGASDQDVCHFSVDNRNLLKNSCFFALKGEHHDGHNFVLPALKNGAVVAVGSQPIAALASPHYCLVPRVKYAMAQLAQAHRESLKTHVVAVVGNVGKTTTKECLRGLLSHTKKSVEATPGNQNGVLGVPLTILNCPESADFLVLEIGIDSIGQMHSHILVSKPNDVIVTNLGAEHLAGLKTEEQAVQEELSLCSWVLSRGGRCVLPMWNRWAQPFAEKVSPTYGNQIIAVWLDSDNESEVQDATNVYFESEKQHDALRNTASQKSYPLPLPGEHNAKNYALALAYTQAMGALTKNAFSSPTLNLEGRTQVVEGPKGTQLILDYYNAQWDSVCAALKLLDAKRQENSKPSVCILGDMLDLGEIEGETHQRVAALLVGLHFDYVFLCGLRMQKHVLPRLKDFYTEEKLRWIHPSNASPRVWAAIPEKSVVLLKGSRGMRMERFL